MVPEVSFSIWGERGVIDVVLWHPATRSLLLIELKTEIVDPGELLGTMDRRRRLAPEIVAGRGWDPLTVSAWIIVADSRTNQRRLRQLRTMLRSACPVDGRSIRAWLRDPKGSVAALSMWVVDRTAGGERLAPTQRVRVALRA